MFSKILKHLQRYWYWYIFSHTHRRSTNGEGGGLPCHFWKSKKCPDFGKKGPGCVHIWFRFFIQNLVLKESRRKTPKCFSKCPTFTNTTYLFAKLFILIVWHCSEYVCLVDNCSVICTVNLYAMYCIRHIQSPGIFTTVFFRYMPAYSIIFSVLRH